MFFDSLLASVYLLHNIPSRHPLQVTVVLAGSAHTGRCLPVDRGVSFCCFLGLLLLP